jgi:hypothetical protein
VASSSSPLGRRDSACTVCSITGPSLKALSPGTQGPPAVPLLIGRPTTRPPKMIRAGTRLAHDQYPDRRRRRKAHLTGADDRSGVVENPWHWGRGGQLLLVGDQRVSVRRPQATSSRTRNVSCATRRSQISCESRLTPGAVDSNQRRLSRCSPRAPPQGSWRDHHLYHWSREPAPDTVQRIAAGRAHTGVRHCGHQ